MQVIVGCLLIGIVVWMAAMVVTDNSRLNRAHTTIDSQQASLSALRQTNQALRADDDDLRRQLNAAGIPPRTARPSDTTPTSVTPGSTTTKIPQSSATKPTTTTTGINPAKTNNTPSTVTRTVTVPVPGGTRVVTVPQPTVITVPVPASTTTTRPALVCLAEVCL